MSTQNYTEVMDSLFGKGYTESHRQDVAHPWTSSLRAMAQMLNGEIKIPHGILFTERFDGIEYFGSLLSKNTAWYRSEPITVFKSDCDECRNAFALRFSYQQLRSKEQK